MHANAHLNLGNLLQNERKDIDGAEAAYRAAIHLDPTYVIAHLLTTAVYSDKRGL